VTPHSLRARLVVAAAGSILAALATFGVAAALITDRELHATLDRALRQRAGDVARLAVSAPAVLTTPGALEAPGGGRQVAVEVLDAHRRILARSVALGARLLPHDRLVERALRDGHPGFETLSVGGRQLRLYAAPVAESGGSASGGVVLVASDTGDIDATTRHLTTLLAISGAITAALATLLAWLLTRRGLRPLRRLSAGAREIEQTADVSRRLPPTTADDEIAELTAVLNRMLGALDDARTAERRFLADASHELRTPVTTLLGNVEYVARHGASPEVLADLRADANRLARLVDDLLVLEREQTERAPLTAVRLDEIAGEASAEYPRVRLVNSDPITVTGDHAALLRAARNLVENAVVHGPPDGPIDVTAGAADGAVYLSVRDAGPGPSDADRDRLFERFWRAPDAAQRSGSGLGLAIAQSVVRRHGGTITVDGSMFTIRLPRRG
jgi:signal transduction histidine kinase